MSRGIMVIGDGITVADIERLADVLRCPHGPVIIIIDPMEMLSQPLPNTDISDWDMATLKDMGVPPVVLEKIEQQRVYDDFTGIEDAIIGGLGVSFKTISHIARYSAKAAMMQQIVESMAKNWAHEVASRPPPDPIPRPAKTRPTINQAPRQSFRQSMRSVNRNR